VSGEVNEKALELERLAEQWRNMPRNGGTCRAGVMKNGRRPKDFTGRESSKVVKEY
jgi:hypothetical protein